MDDIRTINEMQKEELEDNSVQERPETESHIVESYRETELREYVHEGGITIFS